ncbi:ParB/RepB/Spo0J family partition protein, partial [Bartonella sp. MM73XJBT]
MAQFQKLALDVIVVPERIRPVDDEHAKALAQSMAREGLMNPITVRHTPNAKEGNYTLIAGAHRLRAAELLGYSDIDAVVVQADKDNAALLEVAENLFRNELSVIDRALFVQTYRELWEKKYGEIKVGGDRKSKGKVYPLIGGNQYTKDKVAKVQVAPLPKDGSSEHHETGCEGEKVAKGQVDPLPNDGSVEHHETGGEGEKVAKGKHYPLPNDGDLNGKMQSLHFATHVADRIGLSKESVKLLNRIAQHLQPELRSVLRGTALA